LGEKFVDEPELWKKTEEMTRNVLKKSGINYVEVPNEAAFYGPKIDVQAWSVIGREFSIATNQVDFAQPRNFDLRYKDRDNSDKINGKIKRAEQMKVHTVFVIGKRDMDADAVSVRIHGRGNLGAKPKSEAIADILTSIKERRA